MEWETVKRRNRATLIKEEKEGKVDEILIKFLKKMNSKKDFGTSSSCAGRIMLIDIPDDGKKNKTVRPAVWHREVNIDEFWNVLENYSGNELWFKQEPYILHIVCKDVDSAQKILKLKAKRGMKRGGIFVINKERVMIELEGTKKMEFPVKKKNKMLITKESAEFMLQKANKKLSSNYKELDEIMKMFVKEL
ncbi:MAG: hypothetical protein JXA43_01320 [Candidatus Diapherotrites archaeon]|nr:hypothetical protein [Candidatus Diapherotrites archaeon]